MFSLLANAAKYVYEKIGGDKASETNIDTDIDELIARLQVAQEIAEDHKSILDTEINKNPEGCFSRSGVVTKITQDYVLVDKLYMCEDANVDVNNLKLGDRVYYMAYQKDASEIPRIRKIISVLQENWNDDHNADDVVNRETQGCDVTRSQTMRRSIVAKVMKREGRLVFIEPANVSLNLDKVNSTFVPYVGDWLQLESLVEVDVESGDLGGTVLEVDNITPLRSKLLVGKVTKWDGAIGVGVIDNDVIFNKGSCEPGYAPSIGDKVVADSIESDQGIHTWRALTVVPLVQVRTAALYSHLFQIDDNCIFQFNIHVIFNTEAPIKYQIIGNSNGLRVKLRHAVKRKYRKFCIRLEFVVYIFETIRDIKKSMQVCFSIADEKQNCTRRSSLDAKF